MARKKQYSEEEVIEKAMDLFWRKGYENTSTRMLEKEMGINQFSIYSSFGSKQGVFLASLSLYNSKLNVILDKLVNATDGVAGLKQYFYDFIEFSKENDVERGCLVANTAAELEKEDYPEIYEEIKKVTEKIRMLVFDKLKEGNKKSEELLTKQTNYIMISVASLAHASKVYKANQIAEFIEMTFRDL